MSDAELQELNLIGLTKEHYLNVHSELVSRLKRIDELYISIISRQVVPNCLSLRTLLFKYVPVGPSEDIDTNALLAAYLNSAHTVAWAKRGCSARTSLGFMVQRALAADLKISKHRADSLSQQSGTNFLLDLLTRLC